MKIELVYDGYWNCRLDEFPTATEIRNDLWGELKSLAEKHELMIFISRSEAGFLVGTFKNAIQSKVFDCVYAFSNNHNIELTLL